jgi:hypothetical protein
MILKAEDEIKMIKMEILGDGYVSTDYLREKLRALKTSINIIDNIVNKEEQEHE